MKNDLDVRLATTSDAPAICRVVRESIITLCFADHRDDARVLARWLANKTPDDVDRWLKNAANVNLVAVRADAILAAGCVTTAGEVTLNYVAPAARFMGASNALLAEMECRARLLGRDHCRLESTSTALRFYTDRGYRPMAEPGTKHGLTTYPLAKAL